METSLILILLLVLATIFGALIGGVIFDAHPIPGALCTAIVTFAIAASGANLLTKSVERNTRRMLETEIDTPRYERIAALKGRSCAIDATIAKAMLDGRITRQEAIAIHGRDDRDRLARAKSTIADTTPGGSCSLTRVTR